jgi:hypothetical protein
MKARKAFNHVGLLRNEPSAKQSAFYLVVRRPVWTYFSGVISSRTFHIVGRDWQIAMGNIESSVETFKRSATFVAFLGIVAHLPG